MAKKKIVKKEAFLKNHLHLLLLGGVVLITFIIYAPALQNQFTSWDDGVYVTNNPFITTLSGENLAYIFSNPIAANYHPLTIISLALNYKFAGLSPFSYYLVNILFHLFNILLVFWLVMILSGKDKTMSLFAAALFAVHPMHVESVAWISERKDVLFAFFLLGGLISYLYYLEKKGLAFYFLCLVLFLLSALSKPTAVVFPLLLFIIDYYRQRKTNLILFAEKIPFFIISVWIGLQTMHSQTQMVMGDMENFTILQKFLFASYGFLMYIIKMFVPFGLSAFYPFPIADRTQAMPMIFWITPLINIALIAGVIYSIKHTRIIAFGLLFYFIPVALTLQFVQVGHAIIADRYTYLSYIGLFIAIYWIVDRLLFNRQLFSVKSSYLVFLLFFVFSVYVAAGRVGVWKDNKTLWSDVIEKYPANAMAYSSRGLYYFNREEYTEAMADYTKAIEVNPKYHDAWFNRGILGIKINQPRQSVTDFSAAILLNPNYSVSFLHRADAFLSLGILDSAILDYNKAIEINPDLPETYNNRGNLYLQSGRYDQAAIDFKSAIERNGNEPQYWFNLGIVNGKTGNFTGAINSLTKALELKPDYYDALMNRAIAEASLGQEEAALKDLAEAISISPERESAYFSRALYFLNHGKKELACSDLQKAMQYGNSTARAIYQKECENK